MWHDALVPVSTALHCGHNGHLWALAAYIAIILFYGQLLCITQHSYPIQTAVMALLLLWLPIWAYSYGHRAPSIA